MRRTLRTSVAVIFALLLWLADSTALAVLVLVGGSALVVLVGFIRRMATDYMITTRRLYIKHGIISRDVQETKIERVQDVNYRQGFLQRILQIGTVDFDTAGTDDYQFQFSGVAQPERVVAAVDRAQRAAAQPPAPPAQPDGGAAPVA